MKELKCYGCPDRKIGCHAKCESYLAWKEEHNKQLEKEHKSKWLNGLNRK